MHTHHLSIEPKPNDSFVKIAQGPMNFLTYGYAYTEINAFIPLCILLSINPVYLHVKTESSVIISEYMHVCKKNINCQASHKFNKPPVSLWELDRTYSNFLTTAAH